MTRSALLDRRCKDSKNMTELHRYALLVTYCIYAKRDQSMSVLALGLGALWERQSQFWKRKKMDKIVRTARIAVQR